MEYLNTFDGAKFALTSELVKDALKHSPNIMLLISGCFFIDIFKSLIFISNFANSSWTLLDLILYKLILMSF